MSKPACLALALSALCATATAGPLAPPFAGAKAPVVPISLACGLGHARDAKGVCRQRFNLFHHHDRFRAYTNKHCKPVNTPNGRVGFCRI